MNSFYLGYFETQFNRKKKKKVEKENQATGFSNRDMLAVSLLKRFDIMATRRMGRCSMSHMPLGELGFL